MRVPSVKDRIVRPRPGLV